MARETTMAMTIRIHTLTPIPTPIRTMNRSTSMRTRPATNRTGLSTCAREFQSDDLFAECPECHSLSGELRAGREMELASLEID